ncbi:MAG TPA: glycoside hydrolase family 15 protein [Geminicoccaceae bacterium]|nr:glycoside hydrolase family 15 protein [Geminicoccaceae bacterium]
MIDRLRILGGMVALVLALPAGSAARAAGGGTAALGPGAPGFWSFAGKTGVGTSYEAYADGRFDPAAPTGPVSKVWFSIADGIVTETAHGLIHQNQIRDLQLLVTGPGFFHEEKRDTEHAIDYLHQDADGRPLSLAYKVTNTPRGATPAYRIEKHVFTDPDRQTLFMRLIIEAHTGGITPHLLINPYMGGTAGQDVAYVCDPGAVRCGGQSYLNARDTTGRHYLSLQARREGDPGFGFVRTSAGYVGTTDGWQDLAGSGPAIPNAPRAMDFVYDWTDATGGNVAMMAELPTMAAGERAVYDVAIGFGSSHAAAIGEALGSLGDGYGTLLRRYNGEDGVGWEDYLASLPALPGMHARTADGGKLLQASAMVLKALEDKTHAGGLIASLSTPYGEQIDAAGVDVGYRAVWPRDFYQCAMALLALGDEATPKVAFEYLQQLQVPLAAMSGPGWNLTLGTGAATGWFLQKTHVDATPEWVAVQMDQTAMPIMLGWQLWRKGVLSDAEIRDWYDRMLKPAAEFLANGGMVDLRLDPSATASGPQHMRDRIVPPRTAQERWEEERWLSPSTVAAIITGLVAAADIAEAVGGPELGAAAHYRMKADSFVAQLRSTMFTRTGTHGSGAGNGRHYLRINSNENPDDGDRVRINNSASVEPEERHVLDPGFLELVRYGVRRGDDQAVLESLPEIDDVGLALDDARRVRFEFDGLPGFRRYSFDAYGERWTDGIKQGDSDLNRGRPWPFLTGERGHFELERARVQSGGTITDAQKAGLVDRYVRAMEHFANEGLMLPEQVFDGVGSPGPHGFVPGEGTGSATPLAWAHAEYVKLVRSLTDGGIWDSNASVRSRYSGPEVEVTFVCENGVTVPGQNVHVVGSATRLGAWDTNSALKLEPSAYPTWTKTLTLPAATGFAWKCIKKAEDGSVIAWQPGADTSHTTPASGTSTTGGSF